MSNGEFGDDDGESTSANEGDDNDELSDEEPDGALLGQKYSITPPPQPRVRIREKGKLGSTKGRGFDRSYKVGT